MTPPTPQIRLLRACKFVDLDSYEHGCQANDRRLEVAHTEGTLYPDMVAVLTDLVRNPGTIDPGDIGIIDNNIYQDTKSGQTRTVVDNHKQGRYRATYDRQENPNGTVPSDETLDRWRRAELPHLNLARYEIKFELVHAGLTAQQVATLATCNSW